MSRCGLALHPGERAVRCRPAGQTAVPAAFLGFCPLPAPGRHRTALAPGFEQRVALRASAPPQHCFVSSGLRKPCVPPLSSETRFSSFFASSPHTGCKFHASLSIMLVFLHVFETVRFRLTSPSQAGCPSLRSLSGCRNSQQPVSPPLLWANAARQAPVGKFPLRPRVRPQEAATLHYLVSGLVMHRPKSGGSLWSPASSPFVLN